METCYFVNPFSNTNIIFKKIVAERTGKMAQQVKTVQIQQRELDSSWNPGWKKRTKSQKLSSELHIHTMAHAYLDSHVYHTHMG